MQPLLCTRFTIAGHGRLDCLVAPRRAGFDLCPDRPRPPNQNCCGTHE